MATAVTVRRPGRVLRRVPTVLRFITLCVLSVVFLFPFYWVVLTSLVPPDHVFDFPPSLIPRWDWDNYAAAWHSAAWGQYFWNTAVVSILTTLLVLVTSTLAGYAFATLQFRGKRIVLGVVFASLIMPAVVAILPDFFIARSLHWLNTFTVQIVPWGASTFGIFLLWQFFRGVPGELYDAARIDGAGRLRFLWSIGVPLARPALATVDIFIFLGSYNSLLWPLVMTTGTTTNPGVQPIEVGVYTFIGVNGTSYNLLSAATVFTMLPVIVLFLLLQRTFVRGVMRTGIRG